MVGASPGQVLEGHFMNVKKGKEIISRCQHVFAWEDIIPDFFYRVKELYFFI